MDGDFSCLVSAMELVDGDLFVVNLRPTVSLDSLSLRFRLGRGLSLSDPAISGTCTSCGSNDVAMVSGNGWSPKRNGAHAPPQLAGSGGLPSFFWLLGHSGEVQHAVNTSGSEPRCRLRVSATRSVPSAPVSNDAPDAVEVGGIGDLRNIKLFKKFSMRVSGAFGTGRLSLTLGDFESESHGEPSVEDVFDSAFDAMVGDDVLKVFW